MTTYRFTLADVESLPDTLDDTRYEVIDGELYVSKQPHYHHQYACHQVAYALEAWNRQTGRGVVLPAPGVIFDPENGVAPDVVWLSRTRLEHALDAAGHLTIAPELVAEVLSYGSRNESRDREAKLKLYSREGVREYWIVDWRQRRVQVFRREAAGLQLVDTLEEPEALTSPLLPGFELPLAELWEPRHRPEPTTGA